MRFLFGGDLVLDSDALEGSVATDVLSEIVKYKNDNQVDLLVANLEAPITDCLKAVKKSGPSVRQKPSEVSRMKGIDLVSLSNNHIFDFGDEGLKRTLDALEAHNIASCGVLSRDRSYGEYLHVSNTGSVYFLSVSEQEFNYGGKSNRVAPFSFLYIYDAMANIKALDSEAFIVVFVHGGVEFSKIPSPSLRDGCRLIAKFGASLIICHHSHVVSGIENYNGVPIAYSLGNFLFEKKNAVQGWDIGLLLDVRLDLPSAKMELLPLFIERDAETGVLRFMDEDASIKMYGEINSLKDTISDDNLYREAWVKESRKRFEGYFSKIVSPILFPGLGFVFKKLKLSRLFLSDKSLFYKLNLIRNQSHRDVIVSALELEYARRKN